MVKEFDEHNSASSRVIDQILFIKYDSANHMDDKNTQQSIVALILIRLARINLQNLSK
jgi:microcystin degradation protein MlrC